MCLYTSNIDWFSYRKDKKNYYPQAFLEKPNFNDDIEIYSDEKYSDDSDEKIQIKFQWRKFERGTLNEYI